MLVIKEATYGLGANTADVTKTLQSMIKDDSIDVVVGPKTMGTDPSVGSEKKLSVIYLVDGVQEQKTIADGNQFAIYSGKKAVEDKDPRAQAGKAASSAFNTAAGALSTFLHLLGVGIAFKVGTTVFDRIIGYVVTGFALVIPYFGLWGIPLIIFWYRIFVTSDLAGLSSVPAQVVQDMSNVAK